MVSKILADVGQHLINWFQSSAIPNHWSNTWL